MSWLPGFSHNIRLPGIRGRARSVIVAAFLGVAGLALSHLLHDSLWFARFGSLIALVAVFFAYYGQIKASDIYEWAKETRDEINVDAGIQAELDSFDRVSFYAAGQDWEDAIARMPCPVLEADREIIRVATGITAPTVSPNAEACVNMLQLLMDDPHKQDQLATHLSRGTKSLELAVGTLGTLIWGFGDLINKVITL